MSAASIWVPKGQGSGWIPSLAIGDLPYSGAEVWRGLMMVLQGKIECDRPDRYLAQLLGKKPRFIQKGLKILDDIGVIRRIREHGRRRILILIRLSCSMAGEKPRGRAAKKAPAAALTVAPTRAATEPPPQTPEQRAEFEAALREVMSTVCTPPSAPDRAADSPPSAPVADLPAPSSRPGYPPPDPIRVPVPPVGKIATRPESSSERICRQEANREAQLKALAAMREERMRARPRLADAVAPPDLVPDQAAADIASGPAPAGPAADQATADAKPGFLGRLFKRRE